MGWEHLRGRAVWDEDALRDDVRDYVAEHLGDPGAGGGRNRRPQEGHQNRWVQRQDTGTAGRVDNAQVAVYLVDATDAGHG